MPEDLPLWIGHFAELLECDARPASIAVAIEELIAERERQRSAIGRLRGRNAELQKVESGDTNCVLAGWHEGKCPGTASRSGGRCICASSQTPFSSRPTLRIDSPSSSC